MGRWVEWLRGERPKVCVPVSCPEPKTIDIEVEVGTISCSLCGWLSACVLPINGFAGPAVTGPDSEGLTINCIDSAGTRLAHGCRA